MYIIFSFTNIFEFLIEFNWIELRVIIIGIYILKRKKIRISLFMMILCRDPFIITYLHFLHIIYSASHLVPQLSAPHRQF